MRLQKKSHALVGLYVLISQLFCRVFSRVLFEAGGDDGDYFGGVLAAEEVFFVVGEGYEEAVGGFAIVGEVFADGGFGKMTPIAEESAASAYAFFGHGRRT